jgi:hypothetical protein
MANSVICSVVVVVTANPFLQPPVAPASPKQPELRSASCKPRKQPLSLSSNAAQMARLLTEPRKLHIGLDSDTGRIVAAALTVKEVDDGAEIGPLLDQVPGSVASFTADGAYDQDGVSTAVAARHPEAAIIVPPRSTAVPSETAETAPTQRDRHLESIAEHGRAAWQKASGYTKRARVEAAIGRFKQVIGDGLRSRTDERRATEVNVAVHALNRMLELGRPISVRIA